MDILLFTSTHCPHCKGLIKSFENLRSQNAFTNLEIINIEQHPEQAAEYDIRSVPWFKIGELEFQGSHNQQELSFWIENANSDSGIRKYIINELEAGRLGLIEKKMASHSDWLQLAVTIIGDMQAPMQARIGVGAILEGLEGKRDLESLLEPLGELLHSDDPRIRGDACHYLGLIHHSKASNLIKGLLNDPDPTVREIAEDSLVTNRG